MSRIFFNLYNISILVGTRKTEPFSKEYDFGIFFKKIKFTRFPTLMFEYDQKVRQFTSVTDQIFGERYFRVSATFLWISGLILQIITTLTSAYSTFKVLVDRLFIQKIKVNKKTQILSKSQKYFQTSGQLPTVSYMLAFSLKLITHIVFQTIFLFMILWMTLFHNRWENFRYFMIRNYSTDSVIYLSGFLILFAFTVTTLGEGFLSLPIRLE